MGQFIRILICVVSFSFLVTHLFGAVEGDSKLVTDPKSVTDLEQENRELLIKVASLESRLGEMDRLNETIGSLLLRGEWQSGCDNSMMEIEPSPLIWPVAGWVTSAFGDRRSPFGRIRDHHPGVDIAAPRGTPILSSADGVVTFAEWHGGLGKAVVIEHGLGVSSTYGHLSRILVPEGIRVARGTVIGLVGSSGRSTGPHLHYEIQMDGKPQDPMEYPFTTEVNHETDLL